MAISATTNTVILAGNNSSVVFAYPYEFFSQNDLKVYLYDTVLGGIVLQTLNTQYTVSGTTNSQGIYPNGANVVFNSSIVNTVNVVIDRQPVQTQTFALLQTGIISSTGLVNQLDYLTILVQALQDRISGAAALPLGFGLSTFNAAIPSNVALNPGAIMAVNSSGTGFTMVGSSGVGVGPTGLILIGNGSTAPATFQSLPLNTSTALTGQLPIAKGGTGVGSLTQWGPIYPDTATTLAAVPVGTGGYFLQSNGAGAPTWAAITLSGSGITGTLSLGNGGTGGLVPSNWGVVYASSATQLATTAPGPVGYVLTANASAAPSYQQVTLSAAEITGVLPVANGGTNIAFATAWGVAVGSSSSAHSFTPPGGAGQVLTANASSVPTFQTFNPVLANASGVLLIAAGGTGQVTANAGFNALAPTTTQGDISYFNAGVNARLGVGTANQVLAVAASSSLAWATQLSYTSSQYGLIVSGSSNSIMNVIAANSSTSWALVSGGTGANPSWGVLGLSGGGTGQTTANLAFNALNPMTTFGDMIYAGSAVIGTRLAAGSSGTILQSFGPGAAPGWVAATSGLAYVSNQYGLIVSGSSNVVMNVIAANSSTSLALIAQGTAANPAWGVLGVAGGGTGQSIQYNVTGMVYASSASQMSSIVANSSAARGFLTQTQSGLPTWTLPVGMTSKIVTTLGSGTYTPPTNVTAVKITIVGGGGGGGGVSSSAAASAAGAGGGGAGTVIKFISGSALGTSYPYVIGAGGPGGASGNNNGIAGSSTIFASSVFNAAMIAGGGGAGTGNAANATFPSFSTVVSGVSTVSGGDVNIPGTVGNEGILLALGQVLGGDGGQSTLGFGVGLGAQPGSTTTGGNASNYGAGGGGGAQSNNGGAQAGGSGSQGILIIEEYYA